MHEYRRFVQSEIDKMGLKPAEFARRAGLHRQLVSKIVNDTRPHLGQMPDDSTMERLAKGFGMPVERIRMAAARSLSGYSDDGRPIQMDLSQVSIDALLREIRVRVVAAGTGVRRTNQVKDSTMFGMVGSDQESGSGGDEQGNQLNQLGG